MNSNEMNCTHPELECQGVRGDRENCGCRYCVFNRYYNTVEAEPEAVADDDDEDEEARPWTGL